MLRHIACVVMFLATVGCAGRSAGPTPAPEPVLQPDEMGLVVENGGSVDVEAWIGFFGDANRRLGVIPAGTSNSYPFRWLDQDFLIVIVVAGSRVLGTAGTVIGSPSIEAASPGDVYWVVVPPGLGTVTYAKGGRPEGIGELDAGASGFRRWAPTVVVGVGLVFLLRAILSLESDGR